MTRTWRWILTVVIGLPVLVFVIWALATDRLTLGGLMAFLALMVQCYSPLRTLGNLLPALYSATAGVERMVELLDEPLPQDAPGARDLANVRGSVELSGVRVRYPGASRQAWSGSTFLHNHELGMDILVAAIFGLMLLVPRIFAWA